MLSACAPNRTCDLLTVSLRFDASEAALTSPTPRPTRIAAPATCAFSPSDDIRASSLSLAAFALPNPADALSPMVATVPPNFLVDVSACASCRLYASTSAVSLTLTSRSLIAGYLIRSRS